MPNHICSRNLEKDRGWVPQGGPVRSGWSHRCYYCVFSCFLLLGCSHLSQIPWDMCTHIDTHSLCITWKWVLTCWSLHPKHSARQLLRMSLGQSQGVEEDWGPCKGLDSGAISWLPIPEPLLTCLWSRGSICVPRHAECHGTLLLISLTHRSRPHWSHRLLDPSLTSFPLQPRGGRQNVTERARSSPGKERGWPC